MEGVLSPASCSTTSRLPRTCVLYGPGGMGKTQIASQYFHGIRRKDEFDVTLWLQANNVESLLGGCYQAAVQLGLHPVSKSGQQPDYDSKQLVDWLRNPLQEPSNPRSQKLTWLLVFDNLDDEKVLADFWPLDAEGSIVITTRDQMIAEIKSSPYGALNIDCLSQSEAVTLLQRKLPASLLHGEAPDTLVQVVQTLEYWPLVIVQIAGKMQRLKQTPSRFLSIYRNQFNRYNYYDEIEMIQDGYMTPLSSLWSLKDFKPTAARMLSVISLLLPDSVPEFVLEDTSGEAQLEGYPAADQYDFAISELEKHSIVTRVDSCAGGREISVHPVIQEVIRSQLLSEDHSFKDVFKSTIRLLMALWDYQSVPTTKYREPALAEKPRWERCNILLPHMGQVRAMFELLPEDDRRACITEKFFYMMNEAGW